ncbi:unnamed protein product [Meganyctiphanes norvegica]|uniref:Uncharacterized protein n=1 Tax=Meganyctiphanes norvegica TaxID=48144 RepID=A0AAV2SPG4_MEGNR
MRMAPLVTCHRCQPSSFSYSWKVAGDGCISGCWDCICNLLLLNQVQCCFLSVCLYDIASLMHGFWKFLAYSVLISFVLLCCHTCYCVDYMCCHRVWHRRCGVEC